MSNVRSRRLRGSLGDSWGDAGYSSDGGASVHSASDFSDAGSESEYDEHRQEEEYAQEQQDVATPLPSRVTRTRSQTPQDTPLVTPTNRLGSRHSQTSSPRSTPRSHKSTPGSVETSFIMPSMNTSVDGFYNGSPPRNSQMRARKSRQPSTRASPNMTRNPPGTSNTSPQVRYRRTSTRVPPMQPAQEEEEELGPWHYLGLFHRHVVWPLLQYLLDVFRYTMTHYMKPMFGTALALAILIFTIKFSSGLLERTIQTTLTPLCILPFSSSLIPFCATVHPTTHQVDFEGLVNVQNTFEEVVHASESAASLPYDLRVRGAGVMRDLRTLIKYSQLPSRSQLDVEFSAFIETATEASMKLIKYNVKIGSTVSRIIVTNDWTLRNLEGLQEKEIGTGSVTRFMSNLNPFSVFRPAPSTLDELIFERYIWHLGKVKSDIIKLIEVAQSLVLLLNGLEEQIDNISDLAIRDKVIVTKNREELLSLLWTKLGGNRASRKAYDETLMLLKKVLYSKTLALDHVTTTLLRLQEIAAGLESLSKEVSAPEMEGYRNDIPLRYHIEVINKSLEGFKELRGEQLGIEKHAIDKINRLMDDTDDGVRQLPEGKKEPPTIYAGSGQK